METLYCPIYQLDPWLAFHMGFTNLLIFLSYVAIPLGLVRTIWLLPKSIGNELKIFGTLLGFFVVTCGFTHLIAIGLLGYDWWNLAKTVNYLCAFASVMSAVYLWIYARPKLEESARKLNDLMNVETAEDARKVAIDFQQTLQGVEWDGR